MLYELFKCKENEDFLYFVHCKHRNNFDKDTGELMDVDIMPSCFDCFNYHYNIEWKIIE